MHKIILPSIWMIVLMVGLPQLSETVYTPSLPDIALSLPASESMVEYTLTIYLFAFAIGTLFWGKLSDRTGRKPCVIAGLVIFILGCIGCYFADSITSLMASRFVQAFGGSIGSVLGQAICRDAFHGPALGKAYSAVGSALALFPAIGPIIGGLIAENFGWRNIFSFLIGVTILLILILMAKLPETHPTADRKKHSLTTVALRLFKDKKVIGLGFIVAACNGISFSYYAEAPFYFISLLGLSPAQYGISFLAIGTSTMLGGITSKKLQKKHSYNSITAFGLGLIVLSCGLFSTLALLHTVIPIQPTWYIGIAIALHMSTMFSICIVLSNTLAAALVNYKDCIGTASSLFGFYYYFFISLFTLGMGSLHNGTLLPMPLYFFAMAVFMVFVQKVLVKEELPQEQASTAS